MTGRDFQSGGDPLDALPSRSGYRRRPARAAGRVLDRALDLRQALRRSAALLDRAAAELPARNVATLAVYGEQAAPTMAAAVAELERSRHSVEVVLGAIGEPAAPLAGLTRAERMSAGKLANLNRLAALGGAAEADWVLLLDDDVVLADRFLDRLVLLAEHFDLHLVQPALTHSSHTAWPVTRRRPLLLRQTRFVEMGPAVMMRREAFAALTPFPEAGMGWGVCLHWAAVAARHGWKAGIADAVAVRHDLRPPAGGYDREEARRDALELLSEREHIGWREAGQVLASYRAL